MRHRKQMLLLLLSLLPAGAATAAQLTIDIGRIDAQGWQARKVHASLSGDGRLDVSSGRVGGSALPAPVESLRAGCRLSTQGGEARCDGGSLTVQAGKAGALQARFSARFRNALHWQAELATLDANLSFASSDERHVAEGLKGSASGRLQRRGATIGGDIVLRLLAGQSYLEPVFNDFAAHPARIAAQWQLNLQDRRLTLDSLSVEQPGLARLQGRLQTRLDQPRAQLQAQLQASADDLALLGELYLKPFLAGSRIDNLALTGRAEATLRIAQGQPQALQLQLRPSEVQLPKLGLGFSGLHGALHWSPAGAETSSLTWQRAQVGKLEIGPSTLLFATAGRDFRLLQPLRLGILDGALQVHRLALQNLGQPGMSAVFEADIEPIDLAQLCRVFGWPEFRGQLSGKLPGLRLENELLSLDGALTARAFDGDITIGSLRVIQPFGVLPRVAADIRLRNLDLEAVTGAFSFGRIEGRLDGDVNGLRLIGWKPVAMDARIATPPGDRSRHRISQRAIDSISAAGGGPTGVLQRSALRLFEDFGYERVGWSCKLDNGVCEMDGIEPAKNGGYVLVKGRLLPRIDVVGYSRRVGWDTFLAQLKAAIQADRAEIR
jgi:hypothetical protein